MNEAGHIVSTQKYFLNEKQKKGRRKGNREEGKGLEKVMS